MNLKRRMARLEYRTHRSGRSEADMERYWQKKLALPLPEDATNAERAECLRLLVDAQARTRINRKDASGLDAVRDYALKLHTKYGTEPYWADS
jgi:hypothetical protein